MSTMKVLAQIGSAGVFNLEPGGCLSVSCCSSLPLHTNKPIVLLAKTPYCGKA